MGSREQLWFALRMTLLDAAVIALVGVVAWGFTGTWEHATVGTSVPGRGADASLRGADPERAAPRGPAAAGAELFEANGCPACHSLAGERKIGPSLRGIFGTTVELSDGNAIDIDESYLVESILQPEAKRVAGYDDAAMPSYEGLLSAEDARTLAEYIKRLE